MPVNPRFLAARATERRQRDLTHLRTIAWLPLRRSGAVITRTPLVPFTFRHRLELRLAGNAFFARRPILLGDVFLFLWRLHPLHRAPRFGREGLIANLVGKRFRFLRVWLALGSFESAFVHRRLTRLVRRCDLFAAAGSIREFLAVAGQDAPGAAVGDRISVVAPEPHDADNHTAWLMRSYGLSHAEALDCPIALAHQLYREQVLGVPDGELEVFAPSDLLLGGETT